MSLVERGNGLRSIKLCLSLSLFIAAYAAALTLGKVFGYSLRCVFCF